MFSEWNIPDGKKLELLTLKKVKFPLLGCKCNQQAGARIRKLRSKGHCKQRSSLKLVFFPFLSMSQAKANTMEELGFLSSRPSVSENCAFLIFTRFLDAFNKYILIPTIKLILLKTYQAHPSKQYTSFSWPEELNLTFGTQTGYFTQRLVKHQYIERMINQTGAGFYSSSTHFHSWIWHADIRLHHSCEH